MCRALLDPKSGTFSASLTSFLRLCTLDT
jgi:hypothetical protein